MNITGGDGAQGNAAMLQRAMPNTRLRQQDAIKQMYSAPPGRAIKPGGALNPDSFVRG